MLALPATFKCLDYPSIDDVLPKLLYTGSCVRFVVSMLVYIAHAHRGSAGLQANCYCAPIRADEDNALPSALKKIHRDACKKYNASLALAHGDQAEDARIDVHGAICNLSDFANY